VTLCESFLGIHPHFILWRHYYQLCRSTPPTANTDCGSVFIRLRSGIC
jgi:hypothetical protein